MQLEENEAAVKELRAKMGPLEKSEAYYRSGFDRAAELAEQSSRKVKELRENADRYEKEIRIYEEIKNERDELKEEVRRLQGNCEAYNGKVCISALHSLYDLILRYHSKTLHAKSSKPLKMRTNA